MAPAPSRLKSTGQAGFFLSYDSRDHLRRLLTEKLRDYGLDPATGRPKPGAQYYSARELNPEGTHAVMIRASDGARSNIKLDTKSKYSQAVQNAFQNHAVTLAPDPRV